MSPGLLCVILRFVLVNSICHIVAPSVRSETKMHYEGLFCKIKFDESIFMYSANKSLSTAFFWNRFNHRVEIPINAIIEMKVGNYKPFAKGLVLKIRSDMRYEKTKTLTPMNITAVPDHILETLQKLIDKNNEQAHVNVA